jgi:hypothetical protein
MAGSAADRLVDALAGAHPGLLAAAVGLHVAAQACRGLAWRGVLVASWPGVSRRRACAWHVCGAGLSGVLSTRGGDALRLALARRHLADATWPALAGTLAVEGSFETVFGLGLALVAVRLGAGTLGAPPLVLLGAAAIAAAVCVLLASRSARVRRLAAEVGRGLAVLRRPRCWARAVVPWQAAGRLLRLGAAACFLLAFGLPAVPALVLAAAAAQGSGAVLPLPFAGPAAVAGALMVALPAVAGHPVDPGAVASMAIVAPVALTAVGVTISVVLIGILCEARTPRALARAVRSLRPPETAGAPEPAPAPVAP